MIKPHGADTLQPRFVADANEHAKLTAEAAQLPSVLISSAAAGNAVRDVQIKAARPVGARWVHIEQLCREIRVRRGDVEFLDPCIAIAHIVALALELQSLRRVGDALAAFVAAIHAGVRSAPNLLNLHVGVDLLTIEKHRDQRLLHHLAILEPRGAERDVISVPFSDARKSVVG